MERSSAFQPFQFTLSVETADTWNSFCWFVLFNNHPHHTDLLPAGCTHFGALNVIWGALHTKVDRSKVVTRIREHRFSYDDTKCPAYPFFMYPICLQTGPVTVNMPSSNSVTEVSLLIISLSTDYRCPSTVPTTIFVSVEFIATVALAYRNKDRFFVHWNFNSSFLL
jgi:hypothetical protein